MKKKMEYLLNPDKIAEEIGNSKRVVLQFPDGLKSQAKDLVIELEKKTKADIFVWLGSNFGGCDYPFYLGKFGFDLLINIGHNRTIRKFI